MWKCKWSGDKDDVYCSNCNGVTMEVDGKEISCEECNGYEKGSEEVETETKEEKVMDYTKGMYFGELALLKNEPRAASVIAKTDCVLLTLDRKAFKRLLGPLENLLKRNSEAYVKYVNKNEQ